MNTRKISLLFAAFALLGFTLSANSQVGGSKRGAPKGKTAGHVSKASPHPGNSGPAMTRPGVAGGAKQPANKLATPKAGNNPAAPKFQRPNGGTQPKLGGATAGKAAIS